MLSCFLTNWFPSRIQDISSALSFTVLVYIATSSFLSLVGSRSPTYVGRRFHHAGGRDPLLQKYNYSPWPTLYRREKKPVRLPMFQKPEAQSGACD